MKLDFISKSVIAIAASGLVFAVGSIAISTDAKAEWKPKGPIKMMIGFRAGGGTDSQGRMIADELEKRKGWKIIPENVPGKGGVVMAKKLKSQPADGLAIGMAISESFAYNMLASRKAGYTAKDFTYLTTTTGSQMGIFAKKSKGWTNFKQVVDAIKAGKKISIGTMSPKLKDGSILLGRAHGIKFNIVGLRGGKGVVNALVADDIDLGWGAGIQTPGVRKGQYINLLSGETARLKISPDAPTLGEVGVPYDFGAKFIFVAPGGLSKDARDTITSAIVGIVGDKSTKVNKFVTARYAGPILIHGAALDKFIANGIKSTQKLLAASAK